MEWLILRGCKENEHISIFHLNIRKLPSKHEEALLCCASARALAQAAQRLLGLLLEDHQKPRGREPEYPAVGAPAWAD